MSPEEREAWLQERRTGVGSSDAPAVAGLSPFSTPFGTFVEKVYDVRIDDSPVLSWGRKLEPVVAEAFAEETQIPLRPGVPPMVRHPDHGWMLANCDRLTTEDRPLEIKTSRSSEGWGLPGSDDIPPHYMVQLQHQLVVVGADAGHMAVLIGGSDFRTYFVRFDKELCDRLVDLEGAFWQRVEAREAPEPDWSHPSTPELMKRLAVPTPNTTLALADGHAAEQWVGEYVSLGKTIAKFQKERDAIKARIEHLMGTHAALSLPDGTVVRRKMVQRAGYTVAPSSYPQLTVKDGDA